VGVLVVVVLGGGPDDRPPPSRPARAVPEPPNAAFTVGLPVPLRAGRHESRWAPVRHAVAARARPGGKVVTRLSRRTPEGTTTIVAALARATAPDGRIWIKVRLAVLPNGTTGWVPRSALGGYGTVATRLEVDLTRLDATLYRRGRRVFHAPVGVGTPVTPTPAGEFYVRNRLTRYSSPAYGPVAFGTSARSPQATGWPAGGFVGIHGTDRPDLVPGRISHGCIRLQNEDILELARRMPVGTPVTIR
jgi:hypothetical protein